MRKVVAELARAVSKNLGFDENYIEKAFNMKSGFDVMAMNLYPPNSKSKSDIGIPSHTDPGFVVTLMQDVNGVSKSYHIKEIGLMFIFLIMLYSFSVCVNPCDSNVCKNYFVLTLNVAQKDTQYKCTSIARGFFLLHIQFISVKY